MLQILLLVELFLKTSTIGSGSKDVLVEQDSEVRVASVRNELIGDVRNMITGFLKKNRMEPSTGRRNDIGGVSYGPGLDSTEGQRDGIDDA